MSIDPHPLVAAAEDAIRVVIDDARRRGVQDDPGLLLRVGRFATRIAAARALDERGDRHEAGLSAAAVVRLIRQDFPDAPLPALDALEEDRSYRELARRQLFGEQLP